MTTVTIGKRGTIVIPKALRAQCRLEEGTQVDVSVENNALVMTPSLLTRTRLDHNLDQMRATLLARGITLEKAMQALQEIKQAHE